MAERPQSNPLDPERVVPSWLRASTPEQRWPALTAIVAVIALQYAIPDRYTIVPRWPLITLEILLLLVLLVVNPLKPSRFGFVSAWATRALVAAITLDNTASAAVLDYRILTGDVGDDVAVLLGSGGAIYITNIIAFGIWYWLLDRGGPAARLTGDQDIPDFLFPQMSDPDHAPPDWRPMFIDYLYVAFTNSVAFSPTDTMPLARWAKLMMAVQSLVAVTTIALVFTRAVSLLH
ncbi:hypothetical protein [Mycobacterium sp. C31M]